MEGDQYLGIKQVFDQYQELFGFYIGKTKNNQHFILISIFFFFSGYGLLFFGGGQGVWRVILKYSLCLDMEQELHFTSVEKRKKTGGQESEVRHLSQSHRHLQGLPIHLPTESLSFPLSLSTHTRMTLTCSSSIYPSCLSKDKSKSMMLDTGLISCLFKRLKDKASWITKHASTALFALGQGIFLPGKLNSRDV